MENKYKQLLKQYPPYVGLEQFRIICRIGKRRASYILNNGIVPCTNTGKKTRQYSIAMRDIVRFMKEIEANPGKYAFPSFSSSCRDENLNAQTITIHDIPSDPWFGKAVKRYYENVFSDFPDLLSVAEVSTITGYSAKTVMKWIREERLMAIKRKCFLIPKSLLFEFVSCREFIVKSQKSPVHLGQIDEMLKRYGLS